MQYKSFVTALLVVAGLGSTSFSMTPAERRAYRDELVKILPPVPAFTQWLQRTDELPPDFDALPRHNGLPDPLTFFDGRPVKTAEDWAARRTEILELYQKYVWGTIPPHPKFERAEVTEAAGQGFTMRTVVLHVGPEAKGTMRLTLQVPPGAGPFPVVMGPGLAGGFPGRGPGAAATTIRNHGYIVAGFSLNDGNDDSVNLAALYPGADPGALPRRGWAASCIVDYLLTLPEVDGKKIAIYGYSRDGKSMTIGAALDPRIGAVIGGSPGVGGILAFRNAGERNMAESIQSTTLMFPDWLHPRVRFFAGREDRLPVDGNLLLAAIAPRPYIMIAGANDEVANNWGDEQSFHSAQKVYDVLGAPNKLGILRKPGYHGANDWEQAMTFLDIQFGKSDNKWTNEFQFTWDFEQWKKQNAGEIVNLADFPAAANNLQGITLANWEPKAADIRKKMMWTFGDPTVVPNAPAMPPRPAVPDVPAWIIGRSINQRLPEFGWYNPQHSQTTARAITFGEVKGTLYSPTNAPAGGKLPVVVWLHGYSYPLGYMWVYHREVHPILALTQAGYAVLAYDQSGFGSRMIESSEAYMAQRPKWSPMGQMVSDARAAVTELAKDPALDANRIYLFGYAMGGNVALHTAALEPQVKAVISIAGFTPMRTDTADRGTGGLARYAVERPLLPRLGLFIGRESRVPYDYDELLALIAPRQAYIVSPKYDRDAHPADVKVAVEAARKIYALYGNDAAGKLVLDEPWDYNRLSTETQDRIIAWMKENLK